jgi:hypothetical protein
MRILAPLLVLFALPAASQTPPPSTEDLEEAVRRFVAVLATAMDNAAERPDLDAAIYRGAIPAMLRPLDPHSVFFDRDQFEQLREMERSVTKGFGTIVSILPVRVIILQTMPGSPSQKAGLAPGDEILAINNIPLAFLDLDQLIQLLSYSRQREAQLVVRVEGAIRMPLTLQAPDMRRVLFAREAARAPGGPERKGRTVQPAARRAALVEPAIPAPQHRAQELPAPPLPSAAEIMVPRPERPYRVVPATTLIQPRRPVAQRELTELPAFAAWEGRMPDVPLVLSPGSPLPGMAQSAPPPRAPVLPLRSGAPVRTEAPRLEEPKLALPPPGIPAETPPVTGALPGSGIPQPGEPVSVISVSPIPLRPGEAVSIPPVNQVGGGLDASARPGPEGRASPAGSAAGERAGTGTGVRAAGSSDPGATGAAGKVGQTVGESEATARGTSSTQGGGGGGESGPSGGGAVTRAGTGGAGASSGPAGRGIAGTGANAAGGGTGTGATGRGPAGGVAEGNSSRTPNGLVPVQLGSQIVMMERRPEGAVVLHYPKDGNFDVIVVEGALPDPLAGLAKRLSGRPVYTAYLNVGADREWLLHFCAAEKKTASPVQSMVVTLEDPPPLKPPYVLRAELPAPEEWKSSQYQVFHGFINGQGRMERISAVRASRNPASLLKLLPYWEFRAAVRGGAPVEIEVLLVIPPERAP